MPRALLSPLLASFCLAFGAGLSIASDGITYQAEVRQDGNVPTDGNYFFRFELYDALEGGSALWSQEDSLQVTSGVVNTVFEGLNPSWFQTYPELYLEVTLNNEPLGARTRLEAVPYAFVARHAAVADSCTNCGGGSGGDSVWEVNPSGIHYNGGNVGIGTEEPLDLLHIQDPVRADMKLEGGYQDGSTDVGKLSFAYTPRDGNTNQRNIALITANNTTTDENSGGYLTFYTRGTAGEILPRFWITDDGKIGTGTAFPTHDLNIYNNRFRVKASETSPHRWSIILGDGTGWRGHIENSTGERLVTFKDDGHVGVGASDPATKLTVRGPNSALNGPVLNLAGDQANQFESGRIRFTETQVTEYPYFRGGYIHYNGVSDQLNIGVHQADNNHEADDRNSITIDRVTGVVTVNGDLCVTGQKNRVVSTSFGKTKLNAIESAEAWFTMTGEASLAGGSCEIQLSPHFLETVTVSEQYPMQVDINFYAPHGNYYVERGTTSFKVIEEDGNDAPFSWRVTARQRGYEDVTLETKK